MIVSFYNPIVSFQAVPEPNMRDMTNLVKTNQPYKLGLKLNIEQRDLDLVKTDHPNDHGKQLMEVLSLYLKQTTEPSWVQVATALRTIGEGKNAKIIMDTFGMIITPIMIYTMMRVWIKGTTGWYIHFIILHVLCHIYQVLLLTGLLW